MTMANSRSLGNKREEQHANHVLILSRCLCSRFYPASNNLQLSTLGCKDIGIGSASMWLEPDIDAFCGTEQNSPRIKIEMSLSSKVSSDLEIPEMFDEILENFMEK